MIGIGALVEVVNPEKEGYGYIGKIVDRTNDNLWTLLLAGNRVVPGYRTSDIRLARY